MASLWSVDKAKGDSGARSEAISWNEDHTFKKIVDHRPVVGCSMLVGSISARSYSSQDYWLTTEIIEILEEREDYVRFRTKNTEYEWKS